MAQGTPLGSRLLGAEGSARTAVWGQLSRGCCHLILLVSSVITGSVSRPVNSLPEPAAQPGVCPLTPGGVFPSGLYCCSVKISHGGSGCSGQFPKREHHDYGGSRTGLPDSASTFLSSWCRDDGPGTWEYKRLCLHELTGTCPHGRPAASPRSLGRAPAFRPPDLRAVSG